MGKVTLTSKKRIDGKIVKEENQYTIERWSFDQLIKLVQELNKVMQEVKEMDGLADTLDDVFGGKKKNRLAHIQEIENPEKFAEMMKELESQKDAQFMETLAGGFDYLAQHFPHKLANILSIASDIPVEDVRGAYAEEVLDLFDEIVKENNILKLWERVKSSFFSVKDHWTSLVRKATK